MAGKGKRLPSASDELTVYIKPGCPWCLAITGFLRNEGYEFLEIDVLAAGGALEEMKDLSGQSLVPTVRLGNSVVGDCRLGELKRLLQESNLQP